MENQSNPEPMLNLPKPFLLLGFLFFLGVVGVVVYVNSQSQNVVNDANTENMIQESKPADDSGAMIEDAGQTQTSVTTADSSMQIIEVEGGSFYYKPNEIRVKKGQPVTIKLKSVDMMHDFAIDELNVKSEVIPAGETTSVTFTPNTVGSFEFYCSVGKHRQMGMVGKLIVE